MTGSDPQQSSLLPTSELWLAPLHSVSDDTPIRLTVAIRAKADAPASPFVVLRHLPEAWVCLGAITDAVGQVREWVEIWVQQVGPVAAKDLEPGEAPCNHLFDARWMALDRDFRLCFPSDAIETGWETKHPRPIFFDPTARTLVQPGTADTRSEWRLCSDDARLRAANLPPYSTTLDRYLASVDSTGKTEFVKVANDAASGAPMTSSRQAMGVPNHAIAFNPEAALLRVCDYYPLALSEYLDLLNGKPWTGLPDGLQSDAFAHAYQTLTDPETVRKGVDHLLLAGHGRAGRWVEILHLKLHLITQILRRVQDFVRIRQTPFLNLSPESFRVKFHAMPCGLPLFWTAQCAVVQPGAALIRPVGPDSIPLIRRRPTEPVTLYHPSDQFHPARGVGRVRLRKAQTSPSNPSTLDLEGTLSVSSPVRSTPRDVLCIRLFVGDQEVELIGHPVQEGLASGEIQFQALRQTVVGAARSALLSNAVVVFPPCPYEFVPHWNVGCDLYSLGVLALRTLLTNDSDQLPVAVDGLFGLAHQLTQDTITEAPLDARLAAIFATKPAWIRSLGPQRLRTEAIEPESALSFIPQEFWFEVLAAILRLFPGVPNSHSTTWADAPSVAPERGFDSPIAEWDRLVEKSRSLIVIDWTYHREVRSVIDSLRRSSPPD